MGRPRRPYTLEFKQEAVRLVQEENTTFAEVSRDLGVDNSTVWAWRRKAEAGALQGPGRPESIPSLPRQCVISSTAYASDHQAFGYATPPPQWNCGHRPLVRCCRR